MSKIAKFISSALNNSSANEAAQALKMAAATMQKEGLNPAEFLQEKGADSVLQKQFDDMAWMAEDLANQNDDLIKQVEKSQEQATKLAEINDGLLEQIAYLKANQTAGASRAELTEARSMAVEFSKEVDKLKRELRAANLFETASKGAIASREAEIESWKDEAARLNKVLSQTICEYESKTNFWKWGCLAFISCIGAAFLHGMGII